MKKINFKFQFLGLDGKPAKEIKSNEIIAEDLASGNSGKPLRAAEIARKIYNHGTVELLSEDEDMVRNAITNSRRMTDFFKAQALEVMEKAKTSNK